MRICGNILGIISIVLKKCQNCLPCRSLPLQTQFKLDQLHEISMIEHMPAILLHACHDEYRTLPADMTLLESGVGWSAAQRCHDAGTLFPCSRLLATPTSPHIAKRHSKDAMTRSGLGNEEHVCCAGQSEVCQIDKAACRASF